MAETRISRFDAGTYPDGLTNGEKLAMRLIPVCQAFAQDPNVRAAAQASTSSQFPVINTVYVDPERLQPFVLDRNKYYSYGDFVHEVLHNVTSLPDYITTVDPANKKKKVYSGGLKGLLDAPEVRPGNTIGLSRKLVTKNCAPQ